MLSTIDNFSSIIDNFSSRTGNAVSDHFVHFVSFKSSDAIRNDSRIIPSITYSGSSIEKVETSARVTTGNSYEEYTNFEKIKILSTPNERESNGNNINAISYTYAVTCMNQSASNLDTVSYDSFDLINPNYNPDNMEFTLGLLEGFEISIVFAKAPPALKVNRPEVFNESIHSVNDFWRYSASNSLFLCDDDLIRQHERLVSVRVRRRVNSIDNVTYLDDPESFRRLSTYSLGRDGRMALASTVRRLSDGRVLDLEEVSGYMYNKLIYPSRDNNTIIDISRISNSNPLFITFRSEITEDLQTSYIYASIRTNDNTINIESTPIQMPYFTVRDSRVSFEVSSKTMYNDITIQSLELRTSSISDNESPIRGDMYMPPRIRMRLTDDVGVEREIQITDNIEVPIGGSVSVFFSTVGNEIDPQYIMTSLNGSDFHNVTMYGSLDVDTDEPHTVRAYIAEHNGVNSSRTVEQTFTLQSVIVPPHFVKMVRHNGVFVFTNTIQRVLFSTDGRVPDTVNMTNVSLYVHRIPITEKTVIKAVSVLGDRYSPVSSFVFDPDLDFTETTTLATVHGADGIHDTMATLSFGGYNGVSYYTLDESDPLDSRNVARKVYTGPFSVLPVATNTVTLHVGTVENRHRSVSTYPLNPILVNFSFKCNPWIVSGSSNSYYPVSILDSGNLRMYTGASIERSESFKGNYYLSFDVVDVVGNSSIVFGLKSYMSTVNNISEGEYTSKWKLPCLTFIDRIGDIITCCVGYRSGLIDKNSFDEIGRFDWDIKNRLLTTIHITDSVQSNNDLDVYFSNDLKDRVYLDGQDLGNDEFVKANGLFGIHIDNTSPRSVVIRDIPPYGKNVVHIPNMGNLPDGTSFTITKKGSNIGSELIVSTTQTFNQTGGYYTLGDESTVLVWKESGEWNIRVLKNYESYLMYKSIKLIVNGFETDTVYASTREDDNIMLNLAEVNSELDSFVTIGTIYGGCL